MFYFSFTTDDGHCICDRNIWYFCEFLSSLSIKRILSLFELLFIVMERQCGLRNYLRHIYGDDLTKIVGKYINTQKKHANVINQQDFLLRCKKMRIVPPSLKFNLHLGTFKEEKFERSLHFKALNHIIKDKSRKRALIVRDKLSLENLISKKVSVSDFCFIQQTGKNHFNHDFRLSRERLLKKFSKLSTNNAVIPSSILGPGVVNFSSRTLTIQEQSVLEKGPKFCFKPDKVPVEDIISSIETSLHKNANLIKDVSLVRASTVKTLSNFVLKPKFPSTTIKDIRILKNLKKDGSITITKL